MTREQQEALLFQFVEWLRAEYQVEDVYGMYVPEFLDDCENIIEKDVIKNLNKPVVSSQVCPTCGAKRIYGKFGME